MAPDGPMRGESLDTRRTGAQPNSFRGSVRAAGERAGAASARAEAVVAGEAARRGAVRAREAARRAVPRRDDLRPLLHEPEARGVGDGETRAVDRVVVDAGDAED